MSKLSSWKPIFFLCVFCVVEPIGSTAPTVTTLHSFDGTDGAFPVAGLVQGRDGNFYSTTPNGGANANPNCTVFNVVGCGTFFKITAGGTLTTLYSFCSKTNCTDGATPAQLVLGTDGNFYGTTNIGGVYTSCEIGIAGRIGCGTVVKLSPKPSGGCPSGSNTGNGWCETVLHSFNGTDGFSPGGVIQATNGNFYGTSGGGANDDGTIFTITASGTLTTLHSFDLTDGATPNGLVQATNGNFYGTTLNGGAGNQFCVSHQVGCGTVFVFKLNSTGTGGTLTTLHSFCPQSGCIDGTAPEAGLVQASDGNFYGTTYHGGVDDDGTVFKITPGGKLTTLHSFDGTDGANPYAGALVQATNGNFYGTTFHGGTGQPCVGTPCGTIFEITPGGTLTTLHSFEFPGGLLPIGGLVQATNGKFYGTTNMGGASSDGTVFSLSVGLGPFVQAVTYSGKVGTTIEFLGQGFTSSTTVSFNGTKSPTVKVVSGKYLTATVSNGTTTGFVTVTTSGGTLKSNKIFRVTPQITSFSPTSGPVGTSVTIYGESFITNATSVTFAGGVIAKITSLSYTKITVTVPSGAKTGKITVTTPGGTATSTGTFTVT
jgi:uncharacterized repeat protein (TIGR03803 family)